MTELASWGLTRRAALAGLAVASGCAPRPQPRGDVFAAGQPAALLILALAPRRLMGWPRRPSDKALALLPRDTPRAETGALTSGGAPAALEAVAALEPDLVIDYGDLDPEYRAIAERVERRLGAPFHLIDGALSATPDAFVEAGVLLGASDRAARLAEAALATLRRWRAASRAGPRFYYARGGEGLETGFAGSLATEVLEGGGWVNVAPAGDQVARVSREQIAAWNPEVIVTMDTAFAQRAVADPFWIRRLDGGRRRLLLVPDLPFGWLDRPPSVNRLIGCEWFAGGADSAERSAALSALLWGTGAASVQAPRWLA